jgi:hypothetical protein
MKKLVVALMLVSLLSISVQAADVVMTGNNAGNNSSFNMDVNWSPTGLPSAGNNYSTHGYLMRSPANGTGYLAGDFTFAGDSLTVGRGAVAAGTTGYGDSFLTTGAANNNGLLFKLSGQNLTVNNLILDAGTIRDGLGDNNTYSLNGNIFVTANGGGFVCQALQTINSAISGSGPIYIGDQGNTGTARGVFFTSGLSTYNGNISLVSTVANRSRLTLSSTSLMNFTIGAVGVKNSISGANGYAEFAGAFNIDLAGASSTLGDSWALVSTGTKVFDSTFTVVGFTNTAASDWRTTAHGANYLFSTTTGILKVVPEPASMLILGLGSLFLARRKR